MAVYKAPLKDINFVLNEVLDVSTLAKLPGYQDATPDTIQAILEEAAKLCENVLFPLNRTGDEEGCTYENGVVRTPKGFKHAYDMFREGGWTRRDLRSRVRRPGTAGDGGLRAAGDVHRVEPGLRDVSRPQPRRLRGAVAPRLGRAQEGLPAQARRRHAGRARCASPSPIAAPTSACCAPGPSRRPTAATRSPAPRSSSPPASTTSPRTSCISCWRACRTRRAAPRASRCSWCRSSCPRPTAAWASATASAAAPSSTRWASRPTPPAS